MLDRPIPVAMASVPVAGAELQPALALRFGAPELGSQRSGEQALPAEGVVRLVERDQELALLVESSQRQRGSSGVEDLVAHGSGQLIEHGGVHHQAGQLEWNERQDFVVEELREQVV